MSRYNTQVLSSIRMLCRMRNINEKVLYERAKLILSIYREVCWSTIDRANDVCDTQMYTREEKISRLNTDIAPYEHFVMAGSMSSFHYAFDDMFKMMVFLYVEPDIRIQRVHKRAIERFGRRVLEGGDMYESHMKFLKDNRSYEEDGSPNMREQKEWMTNMSCVKIELDGATDLESNADIIVNNWSGIVE